MSIITGGDRKISSVSVTEMDARTLLHCINVGARAQANVFGEKIRKMGQEQGQNLELVSLGTGSIIYEDVGSCTFYQADIHRLKGGKIKIDNVRQLKIVEGQKETSFKKTVEELVGFIAEDKQRESDEAWTRISKQHFTAKTIPASGIVVTRDGVAREIKVSDNIVSDDVKPFVIKAICEALADRVTVEKGQIVEAVINESDEKMRIPVTELTRRKVVARHMKNAAMDAYMSEGFQQRVRAIAGHITQNTLREGVKLAAEFVKEQQEFSILTLNECRELAEKSLAATGCLNDQLAKDVGTLLYRTSCKVNKGDIVESWKKTARRSEYAPLVENAKILEESKNFERDYQTFLKMIFTEDNSTKAVRSEAYLNSLKSIRKVLEGNQQDEMTLTAIDDLISRIEESGDEVDDATLYEVEDLLASVSQELVQDVRSLEDFDKIPAPAEEEPAEEFGQRDLSTEAPAPAGQPAAPMAPEGEEEEMELEGPEAPAGPETLAADVNRTETPISEFTEEALKAELGDWDENGEILVAENGRDVAVARLHECVDQAKKLGKTELVESFNKYLAALITEAIPGMPSDPYAWRGESAEIDPRYGREVTEESEAGPYKVPGMKPGKGVADKKPGKVSVGGEGSTAVKKASGKPIASEASGDESPTGIGLGRFAGKGKGVAAEKPTKSDGTSGSEGGSGTKHTTERIGGGKGLADTSAKNVDGKGSENAPTNSGAASGKPKMDRIGGGKGVADASPAKSDGKSAGSVKSGHDSAQGSIGEGEEPAEESVEEDQYKFGTIRQGSKAGLKKGAVANLQSKKARSSGSASESIESDIDAIAEQLEEGDDADIEIDESELPPWLKQDEVEEGKLPEALKAHQFKKKEGAEGEKPAKKSSKPWEKDSEGEEEEKPVEEGAAEGEEAIEEDNDITEPTKKDYDTEEAARKDGSGKQFKKKPTFSQTDYDGTKEVKTAKGSISGEKPDKLPKA